MSQFNPNPPVSLQHLNSLPGPFNCSLPPCNSQVPRRSLLTAAALAVHTHHSHEVPVNHASMMDNQNNGAGDHGDASSQASDVSMELSESASEFETSEQSTSLAQQSQSITTNPNNDVGAFDRPPSLPADLEPVSIPGLTSQLLPPLPPRRDFQQYLRSHPAISSENLSPEALSVPSGIHLSPSSSSGLLSLGFNSPINTTASHPPTTGSNKRKRANDFIDDGSEKHESDGDSSTTSSSLSLGDMGSRSLGAPGAKRNVKRPRKE